MSVSSVSSSSSTTASNSTSQKKTSATGAVSKPSDKFTISAEAREKSLQETKSRISTRLGDSILDASDSKAQELADRIADRIGDKKKTTQATASTKTKLAKVYKADSRTKQYKNTVKAK